MPESLLCLSLTPSRVQLGLEPQQDKMALEAFGSG